MKQLFLSFIFLIHGCTTQKESILLKDAEIGSGAYHTKHEAQNIIYTIKEKPATIYKLALSQQSYKVLEKIRIKKAKQIDAEALVKLKDGSFWIADETYPSLIHIDAKGNILRRVFPKGTKVSHQKGRFSLPAILKNHRKNKGFESLAISPDERYLYTVLQAPAQKKKKALFIYTYDIQKDKVTSKYTYTLDKAHYFINEMVCTKKGTLVLLENQKDMYIFYQIKLNKKHKKALYRTNSLQKIEGIAYLGKKNWILINDDDSHRHGIQGKLIRVSF